MNDDNEPNEGEEFLRRFDMDGLPEPVTWQLQIVIDRVLDLLPVEVVKAIPDDQIDWDYKEDRHGTGELDVWLSIGEFDYRVVGSEAHLYAFQEVEDGTVRRRVNDDGSLGEWELLPPAN